jgi:hypothetical protein
MYKDRIQWIWVLLSVPQSVIRHAAFILFFSFLVIFGIWEVRKKGGWFKRADALPTVRIITVCHMGLHGGFSLSIYYYQLFSLLLERYNAMMWAPGGVKWEMIRQVAAVFPFSILEILRLKIEE